MLATPGSGRDVRTMPVPVNQELDIVTTPQMVKSPMASLPPSGPSSPRKTMDKPMLNKPLTTARFPALSAGMAPLGPGGK